MKKFLLLSLSLIATSAISFAADEPKPAADGERRDPAQMLERRLETMKTTLNLTPEQVEKIKPLLQKDQEKLKALRDDTALSQDDRRAKMRDIFQASQEEVKGILTPEQQTKWKEEQEKRRANRGNQ